MIQQFDNVQKVGKDNANAVMRSFGVVAQGAQAIAMETAEYAKRSFEQGNATVEKLVGTRTLDKALEIQTDYAKTAYEGFVAQATRFGVLYANLAKEIFKPLEGAVAKRATK